MGASDNSTRPLRSYLEWLGYDARGWGLGRNTGTVRKFLPQVADQVEQLSAQVEHFEVSTTHLGLGISPEVFSIIAGKLAAA